MFKHELTSTQSYVLSKKEKKDLLKKLGINYNTQCVQFMQNNFNGTMTSFKVSINNSKKRIIFYENNPIFFEYDNDVFYPSVYLLNQFPELIKKIAIIYEETDSYLDNGADLMLKGVLNREDIKKNCQFKLNDLFAVITSAGVVSSLGQALCSSTTLNINQPSGKFLKILHRVNDGLFLMGNKKLPEGVIMNTAGVGLGPGLGGDKINEINLENKNVIINEINTGINQDNSEGKEKTDVEEEINKLSCNFEENKIITENKQENTDNNINIDIPENINLNDIEDPTENPTENETTEVPVPSTPNLPIEENDKNLLTLFLHFIKLHLKENKEILPLDPGKLLKDFLRPLSVELSLPFDIKTSTYKKINNFLKSMQKDKNLIQFGKPKGLQNDFLLSVYWDHPLIADLKPLVKKLKFVENMYNDSEDDSKENVILNKDEKIEVAQLFKPNQKLKIFFEKIDKNYNNSNYYSLKQCNDILTTYLKEKDLFLKSGSVRLDDDLKTALFKHEKDVTCPETAKMEDLLPRWKKNLNEKSFITKTSGEGENQERTILTNNGLKVKIYARKISNKNVTIIDGLQNFVNVKDVIKIFSKHFACAVTLKDFQSSKDAVFIQGYWVSDLVQLLQDEIKLDKKFIQVEDKLNLKTKKK
jgi:predicted ribosome-associated RNA-binding protein Tma20/translation initiation factor 1 (eIF-1/SUI1)